MQVSEELRPGLVRRATLLIRQYIYKTPGSQKPLKQNIGIGNAYELLHELCTLML